MTPKHFITPLTNFRLTMGATRNYSVTQVRILHKENPLLHRNYYVYYVLLRLHFKLGYVNFHWLPSPLDFRGKKSA